MKQLTRYVLILLVGVFVGGALTFEQAVKAERTASSDSADPGPLPYRELRDFAEVFNTVKSQYVFPVSNKKLINYAIRGMLSSLDPHSDYMNRSEFQDLQVDTEGRFGGLGIEVSMEHGLLVVVSPIDGSPAAKSGIHPGDVIVELNHKPVDGMTLTDAVNQMRGRPGSQITLTIMRKNTPKPLQFTLTRSVIHVPSVKHKLLAKGYGYVRISQFQANTPRNMRVALAALKKENGGPLSGLILDLRNNPGGVLTAAVAVSDDFLGHGVIVSTKGRTPDSDHAFKAKPGDLLFSAPMVVLVNGGSASASEIVAGALKDNHRALIIGTQTFGKGSVQTILPLSNGGALRLTTAQYYTPNGQSIQDVGITPDINVPQGRFVRDPHDPTSIRETDLSGHLVNPSGIKSAPHKGGSFLAGNQDFQLMQAYRVLQGVVLADGAAHAH